MGGTYKDLVVWQKAMALVTDIYRSTQEFPREELYGLTSRLRRAVVSIASNIAEGKGRDSDRELVRFLHNARGSVFEVETQITIARSLGFLSEKLFRGLDESTAEVGRMLTGLISRYREVPSATRRPFATPKA